MWLWHKNELIRNDALVRIAIYVMGMYSAFACNHLWSMMWMKMNSFLQSCLQQCRMVIKGHLFSRKSEVWTPQTNGSLWTCHCAVFMQSEVGSGQILCCCCSWQSILWWSVWIAMYIRNDVIIFFTSLFFHLHSFIHFSWLFVSDAGIAPGLYSSSCILPEVRRSGLFHSVLQLLPCILSFQTAQD